MRREDIIAIYELGPEAVCELIEQLVSTHEAQIGRLSEQLVALQGRVKELEARLAQNSGNSSKPPSSDRARKLRRRPKSDKPSGGQKGHPGHHLSVNETPDEVYCLEPRACLYCGESLINAPSAGEERRQVFELPPVRLKVTEYRAQTKQCPRCGQPSSAEFPAQVSNVVQYGPRLCGVVNYLLNYQLVPLERTGELIEDLFGHRLSVGTVCNMRQRCAEGLVEFDSNLKETLIKAPVVDFDETGFYVNAKRYWVHSASTPELAYYAWHGRRGRQAMAEIGILPQFKGVAVHDAYSSYFGYECEHSLCNAHHLRELSAVYEEDVETQGWALEMRSLLSRIKQAVDEVKGVGKDSLDPNQLSLFEARFDELLTEGERANPPPEKPHLKPKRGRVKKTKAQNLLGRLRKYRTETLRFMHDLSVPFDNNLAERDIRMLKVQQKISGCFRSEQGASAFCRIRSYIATVRKQGFDVLDALEGVFRGHPLTLTPQVVQLAA